MKETINHGIATPHMKSVTKQVKKAAAAYFTNKHSDVFTKHTPFVYPPSKYVMGADPFAGEVDDDVTDEGYLAHEMKVNPFTAISYTRLAAEQPTIFNADALAGFLVYLEGLSDEEGNPVLPVNCLAGLSPYNGKTKGGRNTELDTLNFVVVFGGTAYREFTSAPAVSAEVSEVVEVTVVEAPKVVNGRKDPRTLLG